MEDGDHKDIDDCFEKDADKVRVNKAVRRWWDDDEEDDVPYKVISLYSIKLRHLLILEEI